MELPDSIRALFRKAGKKRWRGSSKAERRAFAMKGVAARRKRRNGNGA